MSYFIIFGSLCYVHISKHNSTKLKPKERKCLLVGYDAQMKGWKCMDLVTKKIVTSCNDVFDEVSTSYLDFVNEENSKFVTLIDSSLEFFLIEFDSIERGRLKSLKMIQHKEKLRPEGHQGKVSSPII